MAGSGSKAVILLHETPLSARSYLPTIALLKSEFRVVAFDNPGYGASAPPPKPTVAAYAEILWQAIDTLGLERVVIAGIHTGVAIAIALAARAAGHRTKIAGFVFSGIPLIPAERRAALAPFMADRRGRTDDEAVLFGWHDRAKRWYRAPRELLLQAMTDELAVFERRDWGLEAVLAYDLEREAKAVTAPVLVVNGRHDSLSAVDAAEAKRLFPTCELKILEDRGGQLQWTFAAEYADHIARFAKPLLR